MHQNLYKHNSKNVPEVIPQLKGNGGKLGESGWVLQLIRGQGKEEDKVALLKNAWFHGHEGLAPALSQQHTCQTKICYN